MYIGADSEGLVDHAPHGQVKRALDLCTGSGIQGIVALRHYATTAVLVDVNPRAVKFARFNVILNGMHKRAEVRYGDLFKVLNSDESFDLITANPPFIPSPDLSKNEVQGQSTYVVPNPNQDIDGKRALPFYGDGGNDGEVVIRRIVHEGGHVLRQGGRLAMVADICDACFYAEKIQQWAGTWGNAKAFVYFGREVSREKYARGMAKNNDGSYLDWLNNMKSYNISFMSQALIFIFKDKTADGIEAHSIQTAEPNIINMVGQYPFAMGHAAHWQDTALYDKGQAYNRAPSILLQSAVSWWQQTGKSHYSGKPCKRI